MSVEFSFVLFLFFHGWEIHSKFFLGHPWHFPIDRDLLVWFSNLLHQYFSWILFLLPHPACSTILSSSSSSVLLLAGAFQSPCLARHSVSLALVPHCRVHVHLAKTAVTIFPISYFNFAWPVIPLISFHSYSLPHMSSSPSHFKWRFFLFCVTQTWRYPGKTDSCSFLQGLSSNSWKL